MLKLHGDSMNFRREAYFESYRSDGMPFFSWIPVSTRIAWVFTVFNLWFIFGVLQLCHWDSLLNVAWSYTHIHIAIRNTRNDMQR